MGIKIHLKAIIVIIKPRFLSTSGIVYVLQTLSGDRPTVTNCQIIEPFLIYVIGMGDLWNLKATCNETLNGKKESKRMEQEESGGELAIVIDSDG